MSTTYSMYNGIIIISEIDLMTSRLSFHSRTVDPFTVSRRSSPFLESGFLCSRWRPLSSSWRLPRVNPDSRFRPFLFPSCPCPFRLFLSLFGHPLFPSPWSAFSLAFYVHFTSGLSTHLRLAFTLALFVHFTSGLSTYPRSAFRSCLFCSFYIRPFHLSPLSIRAFLPQPWSLEVHCFDDSSGCASVVSQSEPMHIFIYIYLSW